jgi:hypothetical protein
MTDIAITAYILSIKLSYERNGLFISGPLLMAL